LKCLKKVMNYSTSRMLPMIRMCRRKSIGAEGFGGSFV
jgi:hypothetical protein